IFQKPVLQVFYQFIRLTQIARSLVLKRSLNCVQQVEGKNPGTLLSFIFSMVWRSEQSEVYQMVNASQKTTRYRILVFWPGRVVGKKEGRKEGRRERERKRKKETKKQRKEERGREREGGRKKGRKKSK
uniref:Uncharacterized protein n=1 Tax=Catagonus wagneri TaxID=51154 RepID=A0A8C3VSW2_9CETA